MNRKIVWVVVSCLVVLALLVTSCAKAEEKAPAVKEAEKVPAVKEAAPAVKEAAPAVKEAAPAAGAEMVKVTLTKLDGTKMEKLVEKPRYGGTFIIGLLSPFLAWDEAYQAPWTIGENTVPTQEDLIMGNWARGLAGTEEFSWLYHEWFGLPGITGELAESWELPDDETIIFHIRKGVKWALNPNSAASRLVNGREFTADDAVFNIKRIYFDIITSTMYGMVGAASRPTEVYATDKYTLVMKVPKGSQGVAFFNIGAMTKMVPPEVVKKYGDMNAWENVVGTGAFILTDYVAMSSATWVRNPNYWEYDPVLGKDYPLPYADTLKYLIIPDWSTRMAALRTGKIDQDPQRYTLEQYEQIVKYTSDIQYARQEPASCWYAAGRVDKPELPFKDIRVRRALMMGINFQEIKDTYYKGDAEILVYKIEPTKEYKRMGWYTELKDLPPESRELYEYHPDKAKQLLAEAGYPNGFKTEVVISAIVNERIDGMTMIKAYWSKIGVDLALDIKEAAVATTMYQRKTFKEICTWGRGGSLESMYTVRKDNFYNIALMSDPKIDDYYYPAVGNAFFDEPKKAKLMKEMNLYVISQAWYVAPPKSYDYYLWWPWLKNYHGEVGNGYCNRGRYLYYTWIDQELKKSMGY